VNTVPPSRLKPFFNAQLHRSQDLKALFEAIVRTSIPLNEMVKFCESGVALLGDFAICPRSISLVRFIYRNECGIDVRFIRDDMVLIEGA